MELPFVTAENKFEALVGGYAHTQHLQSLITIGGSANSFSFILDGITL